MLVYYSLALGLISSAVATSNCGAHGKIKGRNKRIVSSTPDLDTCECVAQCKSDGAEYWQLKVRARRQKCMCYAQRDPNGEAVTVKVKNSLSHSAGKIESDPLCGQRNNHNGKVITRVVLANSCECEAACVARTECHAWTYVPNSTVWPQNSCFLREKCFNGICGFNPNFIEVGQMSGEVDKPTAQPTAKPPTAQPTVQATPRPTVCNKQAVLKSGGKLVADVLGSGRNDVDYWTEQCAKIPNNAWYISMNMGDVVDYFKPRDGKTFCEMLTVPNSHMWSSDAASWKVIDTYGNQLGGSTAGWINDNREACDKRSMINGWGMPYGKDIATGTSGGHGSSDYNQRYTNVNGWGNGFKIFWYGPATPSPTPCNKQPVLKQGGILLSDVAGNALTHVDFWKTECARIPSSAKYISMNMGNVVDYYKPRDGKSFCDLLTVPNAHMWSSDAANWMIVETYGNQLGGSSAGWLNDNREECDKRSMLNGWGMPYPAGQATGTSGGHGSSDYNQRYTNVNGWGNAFKIFYYNA